MDVVWFVGDQIRADADLGSDAVRTRPCRLPGRDLRLHCGLLCESSVDCGVPDVHLLRPVDRGDERQVARDEDPLVHVQSRPTAQNLPEWRSSGSPPEFQRFSTWPMNRV